MVTILDQVGAAIRHATVGWPDVNVAAVILVILILLYVADAVRRAWK